METYEILLPELAQFRYEYDLRKKRFTEFLDLLVEIKNKESQFAFFNLIRNEDNSLTIQYLDKELLVKYSFSSNSEKKGIITCFAVNTGPEPSFDNINSFSFDNQGFTDIPTQDGGSPFKISDGPDAITILLNWLKRSVQ